MKATSKGLTACLIAVCCLTGCSQSTEIVGSTPAPDGTSAVEAPTTDSREPVTAESETDCGETVEVSSETAPEADTTETISDPESPESATEYKETIEEAEEKAQEQQEAFEEMTATPEQEAEAQQDKQERQEMADDTASYTTEGIPLTTDGDLTEPAKPTASYKLPANAQLTFSGDASTALRTDLPEGCYWTPNASYPNAFTDPAGNLWVNKKHERVTEDCEGYYDPSGEYHFSQDEIDRAEALRAGDHDRHVNGPTNFEDAEISDEEIDDIWAAFGF